MCCTPTLVMFKNPETATAKAIMIQFYSCIQKKRYLNKQDIRSVF